MRSLISLGLSSIKPRGPKTGLVFLVMFPDFYDEETPEDTKEDHHKSREEAKTSLALQYPTAISILPNSFFVSDEIGTTCVNVAERIRMNLKSKRKVNLFITRADYYSGFAHQDLWEWMNSASQR